jgi:hypothetical protein
MSDEPIKREIEAIEALLKGQNLSTFGRAKLKGWLLWLRSSYQHPEMRAFMVKLKVRQGTIAPDFKALYTRKAELDRKYDERP